jgi:hypothetical protein
MKYRFLFLLPLLFLGCDVWRWITNPEEPTDVSVRVDREVYTDQDKVQISLTNNTDQAVYLEGCNVFYLASKQDSGWTRSPMMVCVWEGYEKKIEKGKSYSETYPVASFPAGEHYFAVTVHYGCVDNKPISQAQCNRHEEIRSQHFFKR